MLNSRSVIIYQWKKLFITSLEFSHLLRGNTEFCVCFLILPENIWLSVVANFSEVKSTVTVHLFKINLYKGHDI